MIEKKNNNKIIVLVRDSHIPKSLVQSSYSLSSRTLFNPNSKVQEGELETFFFEFPYKVVFFV